MEHTTLPISPDIFWPIAYIIGFALAVLLILLLMPKPTDDPNRAQRWIEELKKDLDLKRIKTPLVVLGLFFWALLTATLVLGLLWQVSSLAFRFNFESADPARQDWELRGRLIAITALTATLGAVIALPVTLRRLKLTRQQTRISEETLFNEKITEAQRDLYAQRQVTKPVSASAGEHKHQDFWEDDIVRRNAAIDQLERLVDERPEVVRSVAATLSVYVRELSKVERAETPSAGGSRDEVGDWASGLSIKRSDMETAVQTLGRLRRHDADLVIDLRGANLQKMDLSELDFDQALMNGAQLQGAVLINAQLKGAVLMNAQLQAAYLKQAQLQKAVLMNASLQRAVLMNAHLQGAYLDHAQLQGANLGEAQLQGADLWWAQLDAATDFSAAALQGAALKSVDCYQLTLSQDQVNSLFGDTTVTLPPNIDPPEWFSQSYDDWDAFKAAWRAWQKEIGFDPDDPSTW